MDSYGPVLEMLKQRNETDWGLVFGIVFVLLALPVVLYFGNQVRLRMLRQRNRERAFRMLERFGTEKGLSYSDQVKLADIADLANVKNPALLLDSIDVFDRAVAAWMKRAVQLPWLEMEDEVVWLKKIREQVGFRHVPEGAVLRSTRALPLDSNVYTVVQDEDRLRLLTASVVALDDLAIYLSAFKREGNKLVRLRTRHDLWCFFWSATGGEYRFETQVLKVMTVPEPVLLMVHGDQLRYDSDQSLFTCDVDVAVRIEWASAERVSVVPADPKVFEDVENIRTLSANINGLSSVWFRLDFIGDIAKEDLVRIQTDDAALAFFSGVVGQVVRSGGRGVLCRFLDFPEDRREKLLHYLVKRISVDTFQKRLRQKPK